MQAFELPEEEDKFVIVYLLFIDIIYEIVRGILSLFALNEENKNGIAIATVTFFGFFSLLIVIPVICYKMYCYKHNNENTCDKIRRALFALMQLFASLMHFYGDNFYSITLRYGEEFRCDKNCIENVKISTNVSLALSLIVLHVLPPTLQKLSKILMHKEKWQRKHEIDWLHLLDMIIRIIKIDAVYKIITTTAQSSESCGKIEVVISIVSVIAFILIGDFFSILIDCWYSAKKFDMTSQWIYIGLYIMLIISLPLYTLANNFQPLDCSFGCDISSFVNETENEVKCDMKGNSITRLVLLLFAIALLVTVICIIIWQVWIQTSEEDVCGKVQDGRQKTKEGIGKAQEGMKKAMIGIERASENFKNTNVNYTLEDEMQVTRQTINNILTALQTNEAEGIQAVRDKIQAVKVNIEAIGVNSQILNIMVQNTLEREIQVTRRKIGKIYTALNRVTKKKNGNIYYSIDQEMVRPN